MMTRRQWTIVLGTAVSLALLVAVVARLDWLTFWTAVQRVSLFWLILGGVVTAFGTLLRALRWAIIAGAPLEQYRFYAHATNFGYLGNAVLPARAGEAVRIFSIVRSTGIPTAQGMTSAVIDRIADLVMLGIAALMVTAHHGTKMLGQQALLGMVGFIALLVFGVIVLAIVAERSPRLVNSISKRLPAGLGLRLPRWYAEIADGLRLLRSRWRMGAVIILNLVIILCDYATMWMVIWAFGWSLPFWAALTVGVFIAAGTSLPSAPGYLGIYQVAGIVALQPYGIDNASAVAYAIVLQLLNLLVIVLMSLLSVLDARIATNRGTHQTAISATDWG